MILKKAFVLSSRVILVSALLLPSCGDNEEMPTGFTPDEMASVAKFTADGYAVEVSEYNFCTVGRGPAHNANLEIIPGLASRNFRSEIHFLSPGNPFVALSLHKHVELKDIESPGADLTTGIVTPEVFKNVFASGSRSYGVVPSGGQGNNEITIEYRDANNGYWTSFYRGFFFDMPPYKELQPKSDFKIVRSMLIGTDSVFAEIRFKVRLYKSVTEHIDISDGYFKGYFRRKNN